MFNAFIDDPRLLPPAYQAPAHARAQAQASMQTRAPGADAGSDAESGVALKGEPNRERDATSQPRLIAHYIAGMTDRYAQKEYRRLFVLDDESF